jgi:peptidoglycan biosynthesis protein MviN/MurJ (putative lipid II flippase)
VARDPSGTVRAVLRLRSILVTLAVAATAFLLLAAPAMAKGGEGTYGKYDDKVVTNFGFGLMIFFVLLVTLLSIGQNLLERRKRSK